MPTFLLHIRAELENIQSLSIPLSARFCLDVKEGAGSEVREGIYVCSLDEQELTGSKGTAHLVMKFAKGQKKESSINVLQIKGITRDFTADDEPKFVPVMAFECRGLDPIAFHPQDGWIATSVGGKKFEDIDLTEKEWCDFDDKANVSVGVYKFESKFELYKG